MLVGLQRVSKILGVTESTIRRWEADGKLPPAVRTKGGHRRWKADDIMEVWCSAEKLWSLQLATNRQMDNFEAKPWTSTCSCPSCEATATNATLYVSGGGMGGQAMAWCEAHVCGQRDGKSITGAGDGKTIMVRTLRGAVHAIINQTDNERVARSLVKQVLAMKGMK